jgi:hypothetical protein
VAWNLVRNAADAAAVGGKHVRVEASQNGDSAMVSAGQYCSGRWQEASRSRQRQAASRSGRRQAAAAGGKPQRQAATDDDQRLGRKSTDPSDDAEGGDAAASGSVGRKPRFAFNASGTRRATPTARSRNEAQPPSALRAKFEVSIMVDRYGFRTSNVAGYYLMRHETDSGYT